MKLYFLRHGIAEDARPGQPDHDRQLTPEGVAKMEMEAQALRRLGLSPDLIVTSPLPRARQTAEIVAAALDARDRLIVDDRLAPGFGLGDLQRIAGSHPGVQSLLLVGHNPDLPIIAGRLAGGAEIEMKKGGLIRLETDRIEPGRGRLEWLLTPALLLPPTS